MHEPVRNGGSSRSAWEAQFNEADLDRFALGLKRLRVSPRRDSTPASGRIEAQRSNELSLFGACSGASIRTPPGGWLSGILMLVLALRYLCLDPNSTRDCWPGAKAKSWSPGTCGPCAGFGYAEQDKRCRPGESGHLPRALKS